MHRILIIEDEIIIAQALCRLLQRHDYQVNSASSVSEAKHKYDLNAFDLIITDLRLPGEPGTAMIDIAPNTPVLIMTSYASVRSAVDAIKRGAVDYISKPFEYDEMVQMVHKILRQHPKPQASAAIHAGMIANCASMKKVLGHITKAGPTETHVLLTGEAGTGKERIAHSIHELSPRSQRPLIRINCTADTQVETLSAELDKAQGGSLFLSDVNQLPLAAQGLLLERLALDPSDEPAVRLIAASQHPLKPAVEQGHFHEQLFFRLHVISIQLPPLRQRGTDISELAHYLLQQKAKLHHKEVNHIAEPALKALVAHPWPGNIREMEGVIERAVILATQQSIELSMLDLDDSAQGNDAQQTLSLEDYFTQFVLDNQERMTETELAKHLGISRKSLWERRNKLGIPRKKAK